MLRLALGMTQTAALGLALTGASIAFAGDIDQFANWQGPGSSWWDTGNWDCDCLVMNQGRSITLSPSLTDRTLCQMEDTMGTN